MRKSVARVIGPALAFTTLTFMSAAAVSPFLAEPPLPGTTWTASRAYVRPDQLAPHYPHPAALTVTVAERPLTYTVQTGDILEVIAARLYGTPAAAYYLAKYNKIADMNVITTGEVLQLPPPLAHYPSPPPPPPPPVVAVSSASQAPPARVSSGIISYSGLEKLWVSAGGPASVEASAATIAECESGGNPNAENGSGASGLWQILGQVVPGNIFDPAVNAENAVRKYTNAGDSFSPWVCQP